MYRAPKWSATITCSVSAGIACLLVACSTQTGLPDLKGIQCIARPVARSRAMIQALARADQVTLALTIDEAQTHVRAAIDSGTGPAGSGVWEWEVPCNHKQPVSEGLKITRNGRLLVNCNSHRFPSPPGAPECAREYDDSLAGGGTVSVMAFLPAYNAATGTRKLAKLSSGHELQPAGSGGGFGTGRSWTPFIVTWRVLVATVRFRSVVGQALNAAE